MRDRAGPAGAAVTVAEPERPAFDAIVVGAGPAGSAAALELARAGRSVALIERGPFPGSKNVYGGVVYGRVLDELIPGWYERMPVQRWITRRQTMLLSGERSMTVDFRCQSWGRAPYNGATAYRAEFDNWLTEHAQKEGALLVPSTVVTAVLRTAEGRVVGVRTDRPDGDLTARVVIACDGVNSFVAKQAGLYPEGQAEHTTLGVKETLALPKETIDERFGVSGDDGVDIEILGGTQGVPGGAFLYTNRDTLSVGLVLGLPGLAGQGRRPEEILAELKRHPSIAPLVRGAELVEYSAHLIPEGGYHSMPRLVGDGLLVAGDAAAMCLAAGIWLEGVNFALGSGMYAGRAAARALAAGDLRRLRDYRSLLESSFVLADHKKLRKAPGLVLSERVQHRYPGLVCDLVEGVFTVDNPKPKPGIRRLLRRSARSNGVRMRELARDALTGLRSFG
ncbi:FAD-dependent oxidoreductase [Prauserella muralis]|uniref:Electron transfer flavoprotein n=1 Tax=Prauserella muralis TaxID=588067 RepID=A0A2V4AYB9_9PSEU|nr:FAD-dependent oxidoreductase [Prauserella muralis]PXY26970.1 electron transfer flavoprotein [Prauserella muralis]TWE23414.1 electron transfer flavoprotein-quinone oxidoreductase [Prauserella muralis]